MNNQVLFTVGSPTASPVTQGPFGTVSSFVGNFAAAISDLGQYAIARETTPAGIGMAEILPGAIGPGSGAWCW